MADLIDISNGDTGLQSRDKINAGFTQVNANIEVIEPPEDFSLPASLSGIKVTKQGRQFGCTIQPEDLIDFSLFTNIVYVDHNAVGNTLDGSDWTNAKKSIDAGIATAISSGEPSMVMVNSGDYYRAISVNSGGPAKELTNPIAIIAVNGRVTTGPYDLLTWTKTIGQDNVYEAARSVATYAVDPSIKESDGSYRAYTKASSISDCNSTPGSWYTDNTTVYLHSAYSLPINNVNSRIFLLSANAWFNCNENIYIYGFDFEGGVSGAIKFNGGSTNTIVAQDCTFKYAVNGTFAAQGAMDAVTALGAGLFAFYGCEASRSSKDGFNYHGEGEVLPDVLQVNCKGYNNGQIVSTSVSNNGFTTHDGIVAVDIGGEFLGSVGTNSGHVDDGELWSVGSRAGNSDGDTYNGGAINWGAFGFWAGTGTMWLDSCEDIGSRIGVYNQAGATTYIRNHIGTGTRVNTIEY